MTVLETIRVIGDEFEEISDYKIEELIEVYAPFVSKKAFGSFYENALANLICHKLKMMGYGNDTFGEFGSVGIGYGGISSISEGGTSISFTGGGAANGSFANGDLDRTAYGMQFLQIRKLAIVPIRSSGEPILLR